MRNTAEVNFLMNLPSLPIWEAKRIHGSILGLDLGSPINGKSPAYFAIEMADWYICNNKEVIPDSMEASLTHDTILDDLLGKRITSIVADKMSHSFQILIEDCLHISIVANLEIYNEEDELFFYISEGKPSIGYSVARGFSFETL